MVISSLLWSPPTVASDCDGFDVHSGTLSVSDAEWTLTGWASSDYAGRSTATLDYNGDGIDDLALGAPGSDLNGAQSGAVAVFFGPLDGVFDSPDSMSLVATDVLLLGSNSGDMLGWSVANAGDLDGDGTDELLVGAPRPMSRSGRGYAAVFSASTASSSGTSMDDAMTLLVASDPGGWFGLSVAGDRDFDGDGTPDLAVGAPVEGNQLGAAYVFSGASVGLQETSQDEALRVEGSTTLGRLGWSVALAHLESSSYASLVVGAPESSRFSSGGGEAVVVHGGPAAPSSATSLSADAWFAGEWVSHLGYSVVNAATPTATAWTRCG